MDDFNEKREWMITSQIVRRGVTNPRVLDALRSVPRHLFVPAELQEHAYSDYPLPIGYNQTISQPYIVALMTSLLNLQGTEKVLEIGTGSGYQAAVLSLLAKTVHSIEMVSPLAQQAAETLKALACDNVLVHVGDGSIGWKEDAPYDAILVTASAPYAPPPLFSQLQTEGRLVLPVGGRGNQTLELWTHEHNSWQPQEILPVAFVPLRGKYGWNNNED